MFRIHIDLNKTQIKQDHCTNNLPKKDQGVDSKCIDRRNENKKFDENKLKNHQSFVNIMKKGEKNECDDQK